MPQKCHGSWFSVLQQLSKASHHRNNLPHHHAIVSSCHRIIKHQHNFTKGISFNKDSMSQHNPTISLYSSIMPGHEHHATVSSWKYHATVMHIISQKNNVTAKHAKQISTTLTSYLSRIKGYSDLMKLPHHAT